VAPPLFGVVGWRNSGKTTLIAKLIANFAARGLRVAAAKHAHHAFNINPDGEDAFKYYDAGARSIAISSTARFAILTNLEGRREPTLGELVSHIGGADAVLVEGFKTEPHPKLEVRRREAKRDRPLAPEDPSIVAVAADFEVENSGVPVFGLNDVDAIAAFILPRILPAAKENAG
jgi:molybdopterin-guanine dinucleotide biosynthesis adapter protein